MPMRFKKEEPTKEIFIPATYGTGTHGVYGTYTTWLIAGTSRQEAYVVIQIPADFNAVAAGQGVIVIIPRGAQTGYIVTTNFAAANEAYQTHTDSVGPFATLTTDGTIAEIDVSATALTGLAAGDFLGIKIEDSGIGGNTDFHVLGFRFKYT